MVEDEDLKQLNELQKLSCWFLANIFALNHSKTRFILFYSPKEIKDFNLMIMEENIERILEHGGEKVVIHILEFI